MTQLMYYAFQDSVNEIFNEDSGTPRIHPIIALIGEEWRHAGETNAAPDFNAFGLAKVAEQCQLGAAEHPKWIAKLHKVDLSHLLWSQHSIHWWLPGEQMEDKEDDDDEVEEEEGEEEEEEEDPGA
jgi:hypothetical protein